MKSAFASAIASGGVFAGQVWRIPDRLLTFADSDPTKRVVHRDRPVLIVQGDDHGENYRCATLLVMPLSSQIQNQRPWEDIISGAETPLPEPSIVKVHLIQPIPRVTLLQEGEYVGDIETAALDRVFRHLVENLGLVE